MIELTLVYVKGRAESILVQDVEGEDREQVWLPRAAVEILDQSGMYVTLMIPESMAEEKGLV